MRSKLQVLMEAMKFASEVHSLNFRYKGEYYSIHHAQEARSFVVYKSDNGDKTVFDTITYK